MGAVSDAQVTEIASAIHGLDSSVALLAFAVFFGLFLNGAMK